MTIKDVGLRLEPEMHERLKKSAIKNRRSINNEIIIALEMMFDKENRDAIQKVEMLLNENEPHFFEQIKSLPLEKRKALIKILMGDD